MLKIIGFFLLSLPLVAKTPIYGIDAQARMQSTIIDSAQIKARVFRYRMIFSKEIKIDESLSFDFIGGFDLETGSNNSAIIDAYAPQRQLVLRKATVKWQPSDYFTMEAGALRQSTDNFLIVSRAPFFGVTAGLDLAISDNGSFYFQLQESIPNNYFLAERIGSINGEGTPRFSTQTAGLELDGDILALKQEFLRYSYSDLSPTIAFQSQFLGNSISGGGNLNSAFLYGFTGYHSNSRLLFHFNKDFGVDLQAQFAFNDEAPDSVNRALVSTAGLKFYNHIIYIKKFNIDSDVAPAFYNGNRLGFNNTEGIDISLRTFTGLTQKKRPKYSYAIVYNYNEPIKTNINQSPETRVGFYLQKNFSL